MILNFNKFKDEILLESLVLESKLVFSEKLIDILSKTKNEIADKLIKLNQSEIDKLSQTYIDSSKIKDEITFISSKKVDDIKNILYEVIVSGKHLTNGVRNTRMFKMLGYTPKSEEVYDPQPGTKGKVISEIKSPYSDRIYCYFISTDGKETVINKSALKSDDENDLWSSSGRNPMKIGRLARSILNLSNISVTPKQIEDFVNSYKSTFDMINDAFSSLELVSGEKISFWYNKDNYESESGTLGSSCMCNVPSSYFDIYVLNPEVCSLLIQYSTEEDSNPKIIDGKVKSDKIKARALVWKTDCGDTFMDRIYTINDSDVKIFKEYAYKNEWYCKETQNSNETFIAVSGTNRKSPSYIVTVKEDDYDNFPYLDTLCYMRDKYISNIAHKLRNNDNITGTLYDLTGTQGKRYPA